MALPEFVAQLSELHAKAKKNQLLPDEKASYDRDRDDLARMLVAAAKITLKPGETARRALRVPRALPVVLTVGGATSKAVTSEISSLGFSVMLGGGAAKFQGPVQFKLKLPGAVEVSGNCLVVLAGGMTQAGRLGFSITEISDDDREAITMAVFDEVLEKLKKSTAGAPSR